MPAAADRKHVASLEAQVATEQVELATHLLVVVDLERVRLADAV